MREELDQLQARLNELVALSQHMREENQNLRAQLAEGQAHARRLQSRLDAARARIEALIEKLPLAG